ncbi:MAG: FKBP-type 16 kDa peptidyl-prolyl cis-trans isomerase [Alphaproteobacteria bacterium MarineAlpha11_Bin1]|nr:MAG: FKBP-type 16 kDa peptidyl-prolyl cis-trans isomerase [Alphaproteobacteria bacterium MarineAlpha11_Bin1]|tara:strand:+ start:15274 stop:15717 length:444 start_codon:yes stop_codon:yes gene_type:complete
MAHAANGNIVRIHYTGKLANGTVFDTSEAEGREPLGFRLGTNQILPTLEAEIIGMEVGDKKTVIVNVENAYGPRQSKAIETVERNQIPDGVDLTVGNNLQAAGSDGEIVPLRVIAADKETVTLDSNHPLAGHDLTFDIELVEIVEES